MQVAATKRQAETLLKPLLTAINEEITKRHDAELKKQRPGTPSKPAAVWVLSLTPPFPMAWPPDGSGRVVIYACGTTGAYIAAPWAKVLCDATGKTPPKIERIGTAPQNLGTQGARAVPADPALAKKAESLETQVCSFTTRPAVPGAGTADVKRLYTNWLQVNSILAEHLKAAHAPFFEWLQRP